MTDALLEMKDKTSEVENPGTKTKKKSAKTTKAKTPDTKESKPNGGMTTREGAKFLKIDQKQLRRILRSMDKYDDGKYTRYFLGKSDLNAVSKILNASA